jgi:hypothetical protein
MTNTRNMKDYSFKIYIIIIKNDGIDKGAG